MNQHQVSIGLEAGRHGPLHLGRVMNIDVGIDHHHVLDVVMAAQCTQNHVLRLAFRALVDLHIEVVTAHTATRQVHVAHRVDLSLLACALVAMLTARRLAKPVEVMDSTRIGGVAYE